jgi:hypothetical protein
MPGMAIGDEYVTNGIYYGKVPYILTFWEARPEASRGYAAGFSLHCPDCGRFARITKVASRIPAPATDSWRGRCMFKVTCRRHGVSRWLS